MSIRVECPACGKGIKAPDKYAGKTAKCPDCKGKIHIPAASDSQSAELEPDESDDQLPALSESSVADIATAPIVTEAMPSVPTLKTQATAIEKPRAAEFTLERDNEVRITQIRIPLRDALRLIITFWIVSLLIIFALFGTWLLVVPYLGAR